MTQILHLQVCLLINWLIDWKKLGIEMWSQAKYYYDGTVEKNYTIKSRYKELLFIYLNVIINAYLVKLNFGNCHEVLSLLNCISNVCSELG